MAKSHADDLVDEVTANWGTFIENGAGYQRLTEAGRDWLRHELTQQRESEGGGSAEQFVEDFSEKIEKLPLSRRDRARKALFRVFQRFYDEARERKHAIAELVLNAFEEDDYWVLVKKIDETSYDDISRLADILQLWGLREISGIVERARQRLRLLDAFERLIMDETTKELTGVHSVLQLNTWLFGDQYSLMTSNKQLRTVVEKLFERRYSGERAAQRPDLILVSLRNTYLIAELKRPSYEIQREDVAQAETYRDELRHYLPNAEFQIIVIGGTVDPFIQRSDHRDIYPTTFTEVSQDARSRLRWLIDHISPEIDTWSESETELTTILG